MQLIIQKWGNSLVLRIPSAVARQVKVSKGSLLEVSFEGNKIVLVSKAVKKYSLINLLKNVTKKNIHREML